MAFNWPTRGEDMKRVTNQLTPYEERHLPSMKELETTLLQDAVVDSFSADHIHVDFKALPHFEQAAFNIKEHLDQKVAEAMCVPQKWMQASTPSGKTSEVFDWWQEKEKQAMKEDPFTQAWQQYNGGVDSIGAPGGAELGDNVMVASTPSGRSSIFEQWEEMMNTRVHGDPHAEDENHEPPMVEGTGATANVVSLIRAEYPNKMVFKDCETHKDIGKLFVENGKLHFEGDMANSARLLFDMVSAMWGPSKLKEESTPKKDAAIELDNTDWINKVTRQFG